jgi:hypothetical protein
MTMASNVYLMAFLWVGMSLSHVLFTGRRRRRTDGGGDGSALGGIMPPYDAMMAACLFLITLFFIFSSVGWRRRRCRRLNQFHTGIEDSSVHRKTYLHSPKAWNLQFTAVQSGCVFVKSGIILSAHAHRYLMIVVLLNSTFV